MIPDTICQIPEQRRFTILTLSLCCIIQKLIFETTSRSHLKNAIKDNSVKKNTSFALYNKFHEMAFTQNE